ncbi:MAG: hypothetical protein UT01_C0078G0011 [Candidatus Daviesbacteria bacterium GW2011_GWA1_38_7]|nr:MAG: hypothetical protein UT01_C0078G0011 [Candidatus Daviesbacteria bacterium GW2011_GWA1_38_7]
MPIPSLAKVSVALVYIMSPFVYPVRPVPPFPMATVPDKAPTSTDPEEDIVRSFATSSLVIHPEHPPAERTSESLAEAVIFVPSIVIPVPAVKVIAPVDP